MTTLFYLPELDQDATKEEVEKALSKYKTYLLSVPDEYLPKITQTFSIIPPSNTNAFHSSTEDTAIRNVDYEIEKARHMDKVQKAVNRLPSIQRAIIVKLYMENDRVFDYEVYTSLNLTERTYYRIKLEAILRLAFLLRIAVYNEDSEKFTVKK